MKPTIKFSETYLFKLHALGNLLNKIFDHTLRQHIHVTLSQFTLLLAVAEYGSASQGAVARFLEVSPAAINRQVELAYARGLITIQRDIRGRSQTLSVTSSGDAVIQKGIESLEHHAFSIFSEENHQTSLMDHLDTLTKLAKDISVEQRESQKIAKPHSAKIIAT